MKARVHPLLILSLVILLSCGARARAQEKPNPDDDAQKLVAALLGETPLLTDLQFLTDVIGGRPTGSQANLRSVNWGLKRFLEAGVEVTREEFEMPGRWVEKSARAEVQGDATFSARIAAMPFSSGTTLDGLEGMLIDGGSGSALDFNNLGARCKNAFVLIETPELTDFDGLFREYTEGALIEKRAFAQGAMGVVYMGSRPNNVLYRHNASLGIKNKHPLMIMERDAASRALRLLRTDRDLNLHVVLDIESGGPYSSYNVIGEIKGRDRPEEIVVIGAHLDSWGLGTGALDNGCNVAMVIDIARQMKKHGIQPRRTIRFALFNGEEQGFYGSWGYVKLHADELDRHVMASSYDIGSGRINGFFLNGPAGLAGFLEKAVLPVQGLGPFTNIDAPIVGTDNYDFMMEGIVNLVANQEPANYGPNYHARSDTYDKVDLVQLRLNAAIAAAVTYAFADERIIRWKRQSRVNLEKLIQGTDLEEQMRTFGVWEDWVAKKRGRKD